MCVYSSVCSVLAISCVWRWMMLLLQSSKNCRELKTTSPVSSVSSACVHARPLLKSLHWLPVQQRIQYKIAVIKHKALSTSIPPYIDELLYNANWWRRGLCGPPMLRVSLCRGHALRQPSERSAWRLRTAGTHYQTTFVTSVRCQRSLPNWKHVMIIPTSSPLYWLLVNIMALYKSF